MLQLELLSTHLLTAAPLPGAMLALAPALEVLRPKDWPLPPYREEPPPTSPVRGHAPGTSVGRGHPPGTSQKRVHPWGTSRATHACPLLPQVPARMDSSPRLSLCLSRHTLWLELHRGLEKALLFLPFPHATFSSEHGCWSSFRRRR